mmetsp:Transcript_6090/g.16217  ORF Transcript_6090/g.16217 Transcript_6090/m.16217 type:complete len:206 (+) Transcript_6090:93-710(+)
MRFASGDAPFIMPPVWSPIGAVPPIGTGGSPSEPSKRGPYPIIGFMPWLPIMPAPGGIGCPVDGSLSERASCIGCCARLSTTSFHSSRSWRTRSSWLSMCCWEIWRRRSTEWSAFLLTRSRMLRYFCDDSCRHVFSTRAVRCCAQSSQFSNSTSTSSSSSLPSFTLAPGNTPTTWQSFTVPRVNLVVRSSSDLKLFSYTFWSNSS